MCRNKLTYSFFEFPEYFYRGFLLISYDVSTRTIDIKSKCVWLGLIYWSNKHFIFKVRVHLSKTLAKMCIKKIILLQKEKHLLSFKIKRIFNTMLQTDTIKKNEF